MTVVNPDSHAAPSAIISYAIIGVFAATVGGVFALIFMRVTVEAEMLTVLGTVIGAVGSALTGVLGFWLGSSKSSQLANAAVAQLAGAGAPPPAAPGTGVPADAAADPDPFPPKP